MNFLDKTKNTIVEKLSQSKEGLARLAASMINPLTELLEYSSIVRRILKREKVKKSKYYIQKEKKLTPEIINDNKEILHLKFQRIHDIATQELKSFEMEEFLSLISSMKIKPIRTITSELNKDFFNRLYETFKYKRILMNAWSYCFVRRIRDNIEFVTDKTLLMSGCMAYINQAPIQVTRMVKTNRIYLFEDVGSIEVSPLKIQIKKSKQVFKFQFKEKIKMNLDRKAIKIIEVAE